MEFWPVVVLLSDVTMSGDPVIVVNEVLNTLA